MAASSPGLSDLGCDWLINGCMCMNMLLGFLSLLLHIKFRSYCTIKKERIVWNVLGETITAQSELSVYSDLH